MTKARREFAGDMLAWLVSCIPPAVWKPEALPQDLNPYRGPAEESEAMRKHKEAWAREQFRAWVRGMAGGQ